MPTISEASNLFTEIIVFTTEPEHQQPLIDAISSEIERWVKHCPGFISATFHKSLDGTKVANYAQWKSQADWQAFTKDMQGNVLGKKITQVGIKASEAHSYQVQRVIEA
jgi:heme-degrading monooxygenase HmoA